MSFELALLLWSTTIIAAYLGAQSLLYRADLGVEYAATARDDDRQPGRKAQRADRALDNLFETYPAFIVLCVVAELAGRGDMWTFWGGAVYFASRWLYLPLYIFGVVYVRSLVWFVGALGLVAMFFGVAF